MQAALYFLVDDDQEGVMDNLLEALKTGSAFNVNRDRRGRRQAAAARTPAGAFALSFFIQLSLL